MSDYQKSTNPELVREWIDALRSGEYFQARNALSDMIPIDGGHKFIDGFCCLGVACKVAEKHDSQPVDYSLSYPPRWVTELFGLTLTGQYADFGYQVDEDPDAGKDLYDFLASKNDGARWTFEEIADWLEANLL